MNTDAWKQKAPEREKLKAMLKQKAANPPIPNTIFGHDETWELYCTEMRELEAALVRAGEVL